MIKAYLQRVKERAGPILLMGNILIMTLNLLYIGHKLDNLANKQIFVCELSSYTTSVCLEQ